jgi:hypothetical protein
VLHFRQAQLPALDHADQFFDSGFSFGHFFSPWSYHAALPNLRDQYTGHIA